MRKAQTAVEFLTTYGWVILGVIILLAILTYYGTFNPLRFVPRQCNFEPGLPCTSYKLEVNSTTGNMKLLVQFSNDLGYDISLPESAMLIHVENIGKPGKNTYLGNCTPRLPYVIKKGGTFTCIVDITDKEVIPSIGKNIRLEADLNYKNCLTDPNYISTGNCSGAANYTSAGTAVTPLEGYSAALYCGDGICSASIGENPSTCPMDCPPAASIILDASPSIVAPDGVSYSTITATVRDRNGQLMSNMEVVFTSSLGKFSSYTAVSSSGKARVNITSAQAGVATVTGIVPSVSNTTTVKFYYVPSSITLSHSLTAPCSNKSQVVATVRDQGGNRIQDMEVVFSHDATGIASLTPASDVTNSSGKANTIFYDSKLISEKVNLTATAYMPELGITLTNSTVLDYTPSSIVLSSSRAPLVCGKDFGVTAHVVDRYGNAACGCDILFTHNATGAASLNPTSNTTNSLGDVTSLFLHDKDEEVKVEAKVNMPGAAFGLSGSAVVNPGAPIVLMDDWVIDTNVVCSDVTIIGYKFINIIDGGSLTLRCDDLQINNTASEYDFIHDNCVPTGIFVQDGGSLIIGKDASGCGVNITNVYPEGPDWMTPRRCGFAFEVYPGSDFHMSDTYLDFVFGSGTELVIKADYATVTNSVITRAYGDGIVIGGTAYDTFGSTKGVVISGNTIYNTTGYGIILDCYTNSNTISNNVIHDFGKCAISISMSGPYPWDLYNPNRIGGNTVSGNSIDGTAQSVYSFGSESVGICVSSSSGNTISSNIITNTRIGIELMNSYDYANNNILSNTLIHNRYTGSDCRNSGEDDGNGIVLISSETAKGGVNSTITGNTIAECENHGVRCINWGGGISNSTFSNNVGYENKDDCDDCLNCVIGSIGPP